MGRAGQGTHSRQVLLLEAATKVTIRNQPTTAKDWVILVALDEFSASLATSRRPPGKV